MGVTVILFRHNRKYFHWTIRANSAQIMFKESAVAKATVTVKVAYYYSPKISSLNQCTHMTELSINRAGTNGAREHCRLMKSFSSTVSGVVTIVN